VAFRTVAGGVQTSVREDSIHPRGWYAVFWHSRSERLVAKAPWLRRVRSESPAEPALQQAECGESQLASRRRSRSTRWRTREILCPFRLDCERKRESPAATGPTSAAHFGTSPRSCRLLHKRPSPGSKLHLGCQIRPGDPIPSTQNRYPSPTTTAKPLRERASSGVVFVVCSLHPETVTCEIIPRKCKLLLHLGNSAAFFVDKGLPRTVRFPYRHSVLTSLSAVFFLSPCQPCGNSHDLCAEEHVCFGCSNRC
jgi:hypothetical protein